MNEEQKQQAAKLVIEDTKRVRAFQDMVTSEGWKYFQALLNTKIEERTEAIFERPQPGVDDQRGEAWDKGAIYAWIMARDLPSVTIAAYKQESSEPATEE